jgi:hypothetical protein
VKRKERAFVFGTVAVVAVTLGIVLIALAARSGKTAPTLAPVEGVIRIDGKPLKKVTVLFVPTTDYGQDYTAYGETDEAGHYTLHCNGQPGACVGENQVLIQETPPPPSTPKDARGHSLSGPYYQGLGGRPVPTKYANVAISPLTADVQAGRTQYDFTLERDR